MEKIKYLDFKVDADGRISYLATEKIRETEHNIHRIRIYSEIENTAETNFKVNIVFTRADGLTIGPLPMIYAQDDNGNWHRFIDIKEKLTEVVGPLMFGVSYNQWEKNENNQLVLVKKFPIFTTSIYVYDTNHKTYDENYDIYARLNSLEIQMENIPNKNNVYIGTEEPEDKTKNSVWFKII